MNKMALVSPNLALIIFAGIIIVSVLLAWWMGSYANYDKGSFHTFIVILAGLGVFVTFMFYYNLVQLQNQQQQLGAIQELSRINDSVANEILDEMKYASAIIPNFVLSITPLTNIVCCSTGATGMTGCSIPVISEDPINPQTCIAKTILSYRIFSLWQDIILSNKFIDYDPIAYVSQALQRANSSQLYVQWTAMRINFNSDTKTYGDLLFEYGLPVKTQTPEEYTSTTRQLIDDPRYTAIFTK